MADQRSDRLSEALGWFSIGLGLAEVLAPRRVARLIGVEDDRDAQATLFAAGLREIISGVGILTQSRRSGWMMARVGGDMMDLALLGSALNSDRTEHDRVMGAIAAVLGVTALDLYDAQRLRNRQNGGYAYRRSLSSAVPERMPQRRIKGINVSKSITVNRPIDEVYSFWHNFENLPRFMSHLESVRVTGDRQSHWKAKAPAGMTVEWDAEIIEDRPNELISWRSLENADVDNAGTVHFKTAPGGRGTEIHVQFRYDPPGGRIGAMIAKLFGEEPEEQVKGDLRRFKQVMEIGEVVHSDSSIHRGMHPARPAAQSEHVKMVGK